MDKNVAIIGGGPAGLVAARYLIGQGFEPKMFEAHDKIGGQWEYTNPSSGVWPLMRTNTARMVTRFSDLDYPEGTKTFPRNQQVAAYLRAYADKFGIADRVELSTRVTNVERDGDGYVLTIEHDGESRIERFDRVVVASGAYNKPAIPPVRGLDSFTGELGAIHAFDYKDPELYRGKRVLVAGGNISSLEIAQDLAMLGAQSVATTMRRQRYVMPKLIAGTPVESFGFTRAGALWQETASSDDWAKATKDFVLQYGGNPAWFGAPEPDDDVRIAGTTGSQNFLNLVAEDRITCYPWPERIEGNKVVFSDGRDAEFDGIIFGTGYHLNLPFLSDELAETLEVSAKSITLADHTFHPELPGLAFMGLWGQIGPYLPPLELQARYLAYTWGGTVPERSAAQLEEALETCRQSVGKDIYQHIQTIRFARLAGCDPEGRVDSDLAQVLADNAVTTVSFRLVGPDPLPDADAQVRADAKRFGRKDLHTN